MMKKYKLTPRQENFCLEYIKTGNASEAYRRSYNTANQKPATINRNAKKLLDNDNIVTRVSEIREPAVKDARITLENHLTELERLKQFSEEKGNPNAAIKAEELRGKASGLYTEKIEIDNKIRVLVLNV